MSNSPNVLNISQEQAEEMPMVDLAFMVLKVSNTPYYYRDLMTEIAKIKGFTDDQVMGVIAHLYTEINVDGRFACVGSNLWGLKRWYPVENKADDAMGNSKRPRIINDEDDDMDEDDIFPEEEETFQAEEEDFDAFDTDREEVEAEEEEDFEADDDDADIEDADLEDGDEAGLLADDPLFDGEVDDEEDEVEEEEDDEDDLVKSK